MSAPLSSYTGGRGTFIQWIPPNPILSTEHDICTPNIMATTIREEGGEDEVNGEEKAESEEEVEGLISSPQHQHILILEPVELVADWAEDSVGPDRIPQAPELYLEDKTLDPDDPEWDDPEWNWSY